VKDVPDYEDPVYKAYAAWGVEDFTAEAWTAYAVRPIFYSSPLRKATAADVKTTPNYQEEIQPNPRHQAS
jgi:hypothetical protein